jgi:cell division septal protein FtsQ
LNVSQNLRQAEILQALRNPNLMDNQKKILQSLYDFPFGANIFETPLEEIRQRVTKISWVKNASVRLRLPDTVVITVEERTPYAIWQADGQYRLIDKEGFFITDQNLAKYNLPLVVGKGADKKVREYVEISRDFPEIGPLVRAAVRVSDRRWTLHMENGARIELSESNPRASLDRLQKLQQKYDILNRADNINVTSPHQTFFTGRNGAPAQKWVHEGET